MKIASGILLKGTFWTIGSYGIVTALRVAQSIVLARLLAPELFGIMLIVNTLKIGIELMSDLGIGQNVVYSKNANDPEFYNTAWTLQLIRSLILWLCLSAAAVPLAQLYESEIFVFVIPISCFAIVINGLTSMSRSLLQKRLQVVRINMFEIVTTSLTFFFQIIFAYLNRTVWALVYGALFGSAIYTVGSYFLIPGVRQKIYLSRRYVMEIMHFGKWIFLSSIVYFLSINFDKLYLGRAVPLNLFGVYGIARAIADLLGNLVARLGNYVLFPFIVSHSQMPRADLREQLAPLRARFLLLAALGFSLFIATADLAIRIFYDQRYQAASWMLPVLTVGSWFSILANVSESTLLGLGKPSYGAISNGLKFIFLLIGLPLGVEVYGLVGGIAVIALVDLVRYLPILIGQKRERFSFASQDLLITLAMFLLTGLWELLRFALGVGTSFDSLPLGVFLRNS
jgi:O-antigen/teichoic acid export membrane protein